MLERSTLFNTSLEAGLRSLALLVAVFPNSLSTGQLVALDHILVHSRDFDQSAPESLHPASPYRRTEPVIRRKLIIQGVDLMVSRGLISRLPTRNGFVYSATEETSSFLAALSTPYWHQLIDRSAWIAGHFGSRNEAELESLIHTRLDDWVSGLSNLALSDQEAS